MTIQEQARAELKKEAEGRAVRRAKELIQAISIKQNEINKLRKDLASVEIEDVLE